MSGYLTILLGIILVNNYVLAQFLGICPFLGVSKKLDSAVGMGAAVIFVMVLATAVTWPIMQVLNDLNIAYLQTIVFILIIAALVQFVEMALKKFIPALHKSLGVYLPEDRPALKKALEEVLCYGSRVLVEERIFGRELTVAVLGQRWLPAVETVPAGKEFDYAAKYQAGAAEETCPAHITDAEMRAAGELALRVHRALGLEVYSRTDMILDKDGQLWCLEANSLPGMTPTSFVPKEAAAVGMSYGELCEEIVRQSCQLKRRAY